MSRAVVLNSQRRRLLPWRKAWIAIVALVALRLSWLTVSLLLGSGDVKRHHVEANAYVLAVLLALYAVTRRCSRDKSCRQNSPHELRLWEAAAVTLVGLLLYYPALSLGLLSDDFVLIRWSNTFNILPSSWDYFRPLPLATWWLITRLVPSSIVSEALHFLNIGLHIANAILLIRVAAALGLSRRRALVSGLLFVCFPLSVEAVVWPSALPDLALTLVALVVVDMSLRSARLSLGLMFSMFVLTGIALAIKETAVTLPLLIVACLFATRAAASRYRLALASGAVVAAYAAARLVNQELSGHFAPMSGYVIKELVSRPFGALGLPFHEDLIRSSRLLVAGFAGALPWLFARGSWTWNADPEGARRFIGLAMFVLASVAPLLAMLFVGADLQGARYLYLGTTAWAIALGQALPNAWGAGRIPSIAVAVLLVSGFWAATDAHLRLWKEASETRDQILAQIRRDLSTCETLAVSVEVPVAKTYRGAYVFTNGLSEALSLEGIENRPGPTGSAVVHRCVYVPSDAGNIAKSLP